MIRRVLVILACCALFVATACSSTVATLPTPSPATASARQSSQPIHVTILHTNDMHGALTGETITGGDDVKFEFGGIANVMGTIAAIKDQPLQADQVYRVQTIDYLLGGGDGQTPFTLGKNVAYGDPVVDVLAAYIQQHSPLDVKTEGRILAAGQNQ